jgi:hypothetical protein
LFSRDSTSCGVIGRIAGETDLTSGLNAKPVWRCELGPVRRHGSGPACWMENTVDKKRMAHKPPFARELLSDWRQIKVQATRVRRLRW